MTTSLQNLVAKGAWVVVGAICVVAFTAMFITAGNESAIMDELAHIPAGYGYVHELDFRLNPEHPPLVKMLAGLPLLLLQPKFPTENIAWQNDVNGQWDMGTQFLYFSGNDPQEILRFARLGPMFLTILLALLIFVWAKELMGSVWATVPTALFALSPNILAHGRYVTTDVAAAFGIAFATYFFLKFLARPSGRTLFWAGLAFGVGQAAKFSAVLLLPFFVFLALVAVGASIVRRWPSVPQNLRLRSFSMETLRMIGRVAAIFVIGYLLIIYPLYAIFTINYPIERQVSDTTITLTSFAGGPTPPGAICKPVRCLADATIWAAKNPVTRPFSEYALGVLMVIQRSSGGNTNYFLGEVSAGGWRYYFPVVYAIKEPLPVVILVAVALFFSLARLGRTIVRERRELLARFSDWIGTHLTEFAMAFFIVFYWTYSMNSPLNIGFRHLFPTLPFIYILVVQFWKNWVLDFSFARPTSALHALATGAKTVVAASLKYAVFVVLFFWFVVEGVLAAPYYLSYFNQLAGGTWQGYRYVTDSNYDWGQDMLRLNEFVASRAEIDRIGVDYFGGGNPKYYLGAKAENWWSSRGNPANEGIRWLAVSVNTLEGAIQPTVAGFTRKPEDSYQWLTAIRPPRPGMGEVPKPDYRVGTSIFVYKL